jgi:hypothetical protein
MTKGRRINTEVHPIPISTPLMIADVTTPTTAKSVPK